MHRNTPIEYLENRIAPAAIVTVEFTNGQLVLGGDDGGAGVSLTAVDANTFILAADSGTTFTKGMDTGLTRIVLTGSLKSLSATFGSGEDHFDITGVDVKGNIDIELGAGDNELHFDSITATGNLTVKGGTDSDEVSFAGEGASIKGFASFELSRADSGVNLLEIGGTNFSVGKDLTFTGGSGIDNVALVSNVKVKGKASLDLGSGDGGVAAIGANFSIGKKLEVIAPTLGEGMDPAENVSIIFIAPMISAGEVDIQTGAGDDSVTFGTIGGKSSVKGNFSVSTGDGADNITALFYGGRAKNVTFDGGDGENTYILAVAGSSVSSVKIFGGDDADSATILAIGGKIGAIEADLGDAKLIPDPDNVGEMIEQNNALNAIAVNSSIKSIKLTGGADADGLTAINIHSKVGGITADLGAGSGGGIVFALGGSTGLLKFTSESTGTDSTSFFIAGAQTTTAGIDINTGNGSSNVGIQPLTGGGGLPLPLPIPISLPDLSGLVQGWKVKGATKITSGSGEDTLTVGGPVELAGGLTANLGDGTNFLQGAVDGLKVKKFTYTGGDGDDTIGFLGRASFGSAVLNLGKGSNSAIFAGASKLMSIGSLEVTSNSLMADNDALTLARVQVSGKLNATLGDGASTVQIDDSVFGNTVTVKTGAGADSVSIDTDSSGYATTFSKAVSIDLGADDDLLTIGGNPEDRLIITKSKFSADGGAGTNTVTVTEADNILASPLDLKNFA